MVLAVICAVFFALALLGMPLVWALLLTTVATIGIFGMSYPLEAIFLSYISSLEPLHLAAIPLFIFTGELITHGGVGRRLIDFARSLLAFMPGGLGVVTVSACTMFGSVSGSAVADSAAIGSIMVPRMAERGYPRAFAAALIAVAGTIGVLMPLSIPLLVYGFVGNVSIRELLVSGVFPAFTLAFVLILLCVWKGRSLGCDLGGAMPSRADIWKSFLAILPASGMPVVILGGILTGIFTPTEAASVAVFYGLVLALFVYREIKPAQVPGMLLQSFRTSAVVMLVVGATGALSWLITVEQIPANLAQAILNIAENKYVFLFLLNLALILVGIFLEPLPSLMLTAPLFIPTAKAFGIDPVHLGLIMVFNLVIGLYTPPVGGTLFVAAKIARVGMVAISRELIPMFILALCVLFLVTYVEAIPMALVWLMRG
ncbi:TRAP transporter large permease [Bosea sp. (in: a-proteobacteria)]|jgi:C4-dicarboxylate transporter DctM subunit|uniref:TRAP transporter large permease n=1 Tax=Bosea sp. (in: a-proteobacteria) TaxID=1871050 RepID=UPI002DDDA74B|nr:TRAP transporter large permease [Bosea sp. (in: a-proteobacteria)]HEV2508335.1 TRAP transporter large permease [Bosea sp. (in: a-proteobacteria)]